MIRSLGCTDFANSPDWRRQLAKCRKQRLPRRIYESTKTLVTILSACDSGAGEVKIGEGVTSLCLAFRIAGAETVLASHWKVSDKATSLLMTEFMRRWREGESRSNAWREAQLTLLRSKDFSDPFFWSAFTLSGQWR